MARLRVGVLASGRGSNLQALLDGLAGKEAPAEVVLAVADRPGTGALRRAEAAGVAARVVDRGDFSERDGFDEAVDEILREKDVGLVCLAGFMRILGAGLVGRWTDRIVNIHPSLLPMYPGLDTHARAIAGGGRVHGCTVHFVRPEVDAGPVIAQAAVPILPGDDPEGLAARVLAAEHRIYPRAVRWIAEGRVRVVDGVAMVEGVTWDGSGADFPGGAA